MFPCLSSSQVVIPDSIPPYSLQWSHTALGVRDAWNLGARGAGVRVAVIDSGLLTSHPDLVGQNNAELSISFAEGVAWDQPQDTHGTAVSGLIAASDNGSGIVGVAPEAEIVTILTSTDPGERAAGIVEAVRYAVDRGIEVVNISQGALFPAGGGCGLGDVVYCPTAEELTTMLEAAEQAGQHAWEHGTLVLVSSGNEGVDRDVESTLVQFPGDSEFIFVVSSTGPVGWARDRDTSLDRPVPSANIGMGFVTFSAPGGGASPIDRTDICSIEELSRPCGVFDQLLFASFTSEGSPSYRFGRGTSYAVAHASGVAALLFSVLEGEERTASRVLELMRDGAQDLGEPGYDPIFGFGRLSAGKSVALALGF